MPPEVTTTVRSDDSDEALASAFKDGDDAAFSLLYSRYVGAIHDHVRGIVRDSASAEDVAQATFMQAFERRETLRDPASFRAWLYRIAHNLALNQVTRVKPVVELDPEVSLPAGEPGPEEQALQAQAVALVWDAAASLSPRQFAVLDMSLRQGLTSREIGDVLGLDAGQAAVVANRAREALGNAVRYLMVARRRRHCDRLAELVPAGVRRLSPDQRASVDRHLRRCAACQHMAKALTAPGQLFGAIPFALVPRVLADWTPPSTGSAHLLQQSASLAQRHTPRPRLPGRSVLLPTAGAVVAVLIVGGVKLWHPGRDAPEHPNVGNAASGAPSSAAALAATKSVRFQPFARGNAAGGSTPKPGATVSDSIGTCDSGSADDPGRAAAFRCVSADGAVGNGTPCFADTSAGDPGSPLLCTDDPTGEQLVRLRQTPGSQLPLSFANPDDPAKPPWFLVLSDGNTCSFSGYGTNTLVTPYDCGGGLGASLPDRSEPIWTVREAPFGSEASPSKPPIAVITAIS